MIQCRGDGGGANPLEGRCRNPYLLRGIQIEGVHQEWSTDIIYIPMAHGFGGGVRDWYSRFVRSGVLSMTREREVCVEVLRRAPASTITSDASVTLHIQPGIANAGGDLPGMRWAAA